MKRWTSQEIRRLKELYKNPLYTTQDIAEELGRPLSSIHRKKYELRQKGEMKYIKYNRSRVSKNPTLFRDLRKLINNDELCNKVIDLIKKRKYL